MTDKRTTAVAARIKAALADAGVQPDGIGDEIQPTDEHYTDGDPNVAAAVVPVDGGHKPLLVPSWTNRQQRRRAQQKLGVHQPPNPRKSKGGKALIGRRPTTTELVVCQSCKRRIEVALVTPEATFAYCLGCRGWSSFWSERVVDQLRALRIEKEAQAKGAAE